MSVSPSDFFQSAKELASNVDEISRRNSVSRAYYAAYHHMSSIIPYDGDSVNGRNAGMHRSYINQLMEANQDSVERKAGVKLQSLHARRVKADYRICDNLDARMVSMQIDGVNFIFNLVPNDYSPEVPPKGKKNNESSPPSVKGSGEEAQSGSRPILRRVV